jgi:hypothetical protein
MIAREYTKFISEMVCHPKAVGAIAPSSSNLARHLVDSVDWHNTSTLVEYGPGTGVITEQILSQLPPETTFLAIEISARFAEMLRTRFPGVDCRGPCSRMKIRRPTWMRRWKCCARVVSSSRSATSRDCCSPPANAFAANSKGTFPKCVSVSRCG